MEEREKKENQSWRGRYGGDEFNYDVFDIL
jgi:hypothetical protein